MDDGNGRRERRRAGLVLGLVFVLGLVCGAALFHLGQRSVGPHPPAGPPPHPLAFLTRELGLDEAQEREVREILERHRGGIARLLEESRLELREVLRPEQRLRFDRLRPPGPPPPGAGPHPPPPPRN